MRLKELAIYNNIRILMKKNGLTSKDFAEKVGISYKTIESILCENSKPRVSTLILIANRFNVTMDWLCTERDPE